MLHKTYILQRQIGKDATDKFKKVAKILMSNERNIASEFSLLLSEGLPVMTKNPRAI